MKRNKPLQRRTALKRRKSLSRVSAARRDLNQQYRDSVAADGVLVRDGETGLPMTKASLEPHHVHGRRGKWILLYVWITPKKHREIHENSKRAFKEGWLSPVYRGGKFDPDHPRPWKKGTLVNENLLDTLTQ
jgi:hypothetical protein